MNTKRMNNIILCFYKNPDGYGFDGNRVTMISSDFISELVIASGLRSKNPRKIKKRVQLIFNKVLKLVVEELKREHREKIQSEQA